MPFDLDVMDADWRSQLSEEQLDALERRQTEQNTRPAPQLRLVGAERARLEQQRGGNQ